MRENKLTLLRILIIPIIIIVSLINGLAIDLNSAWINGGFNITIQNLIILVLFAVASFTDFLDGHIARKHNLVTDFGKFMDPLADKLLVMTALIILLEQGKLNILGIGLGFVVIIILAREFMVTGIRLIAVQNQKVIAASKLGKAKTVTQIIMIIVLLFDFSFSSSFDFADVIKLVVILVPFILTVVSGIDYFWKNKEIILSDK